MDQTSLFSRAAYSPLDKDSLTGTGLESLADTGQQVFYSGGDINVFFGHKRVGRLESISWSIVTDGAQLFEMGMQDSIGLVKGKRAIAGSMMFSLADQDAILEAYLGLSARGILTVRQLWDPTLAAYANSARTATTANFIDSTTASAKTAIGGSLPTGEVNVFPTLQNAQSFESQFQNNVRAAASLAGSRKIEYADQLPPLDVTIVGVKDGQVSATVLFGVEFLQEAGSMTLADMSSSQAFNFMARHRRHWQKVDTNGNTAGIASART